MAGIVREAGSGTKEGRAAASAGRGWAGGLVAALLVLGVAAVCVRLGFWQLDRLEQRRARNAQIEQALALPTLSLDPQLLREVERDPATFLNRRVRVEGVFETGGEVVLRGRSRQGQPGVHLVTPLRIAGSEAALLVNRGWIPAADAATLDPAPFALGGVQQIEGLLQIVPAPPEGGMPLVVETASGSVLTMRRLDLPALRAQGAQPLLSVYLQQLPDPALAPPPFAIPLPTLDEGSHLGYAVQWFSFAAIFLLGFLIVVVRRRNPRPS